jgi:hypothetical protein
VASESLVLVDGREATIVDLSNGSKTALLFTVREARERGATEISSLVLTHYNIRTPGSLCLLFGQAMVRTMYLPSPQDDEDYYTMLSCMEKAELYSVPVCLYEDGTDISAAEGAGICVETALIERSVRPIHTVEIATDEQRLLYCGAAFSESELLPSVVHKTGTCYILIFGNQGPIIKESYGVDLPIGEGTTVVLADELTAAWMEADVWTRSAELWMGPWHGKMMK